MDYLQFEYWAVGLASVLIVGFLGNLLLAVLKLLWLWIKSKLPT